MSKVTNINGSNIKPIKLTNNVDVPFVICFKDKLTKGYTFEDLEKINNKELQNFLNIVSQLSVTEVDKKYRRKTDKEDKYQGQQVFHYQVSDSFRIHVINYNGSYEVIRLDPNHKVHNK